MKYAILITLLFIVTVAVGQPGRLDRTFGNFPWVTTDFGYTEAISSIAIQPDGKIIAIGSSNWNIAISRYLTNGIADSSFWKYGKVLLSFDNNPVLGKSILIEPDSSIIIGGVAVNENGGSYHFIMERLLPDGSIDSSFGSKGKATTFFLSTNVDLGYRLALQHDGKIIMGGTIFNAGTGYDFIIARYNKNGSPDSSFNGRGYVTMDFNNNQTDYLSALTIQDDGKIVVAGETQGIYDSYVFARFDTSGSLDKTFESGARDAEQNLYSKTVVAVHILPNGKILALGIIITQASNVYNEFLRYNPDGTPDLSFGSQGRVAISDSGETLPSFVLTPDNKMLLCGGTSAHGTNDFIVRRFTEDGSPDLSFGAKGSTITDFSGNDDRAKSCVLQHDGKIVVGGYTNSDFALVRYNFDGNIDESFGKPAKTITSNSPGDDEANTISISSSGRLYLGGHSEVIVNNSDLVAICYKANGKEDPTFSKINQGRMYLSDSMKYLTVNTSLNQSDAGAYFAGDLYNPSTHVVEFALLRYISSTTSETLIATTDFGGGSNYCKSLLQQDVKFVLCGYAFTDRNYDFAVLRYSYYEAGLDSTFGINGKVTTDLQGNQDYAYASALQTDNKIILAGTSYNDKQWQIALVRYNSNGSLDNSFGKSGIVLTAIGDSDDCAKAVQVQKDGRIVVAGFTHNAKNYDVALLRYNSNGNLDSTFGKFGIVETPIGSGDAKANGMVIQPDGKIIIAGYSFNGKDNDFMLACYNSNGSLDNKFGNGGITTTDFGFGNDHANALALQSDGSIVVAGYAFNGKDKDYAVARYLPDLSLGVIDRPMGNKVALIYPNPIGNTAKLEYELIHAQEVTIKLFDVLGNERATFINNDNRREGKNDEQINFPNGLPSGCYYLVVETKESKTSVKVIKE